MFTQHLPDSRVNSHHPDLPLQEYRRGYDEGWHANLEVNLSDRKREFNNGYEKGVMDTKKEFVLIDIHKELAKLKVDGKGAAT